MGNFNDFICSNCSKKNKEEDNYYIQETNPIVPKSIIDLKVDAKNFITKSGQNVYDIYEKICELGAGAFGTVYKVKRKNSGMNPIIRALKEISKEAMINEESGEEIRNEIEILKNIDHPNIMKIYEFFEDDMNMYLVSEFCGAGDVAGMNDLHGIFPEFLLKYIMSQVFLAISFLHSNKVVHGDIKRENIAFVYNGKLQTKEELEEFFAKIFNNKKLQEELNEANGTENLSDEAMSIIKELCNYDIKILDFGSAKMKKKDRINKKLSGIIGTTYYCSPEVIKNKYDFECDEWACGIMMYILLAGEPPFDGEDEDQIFDKILNDEINFNIPSMDIISDECKDLIGKLCEKNPQKRIKADEALKHPFFLKGINFSNILKGKYAENTEALKKMINNQTLKNRKESKFMEMVIAYIGLNFPDQEEALKAKQIFLEISGGNKHYLITKETFVSRFEKAMKNLTKKEIEDLFDRIDQNESGNIEYEELIRALSDKEKLLSDKNLEEAFKFFDKDNSGFITWDEIAAVVYPDGDIPENIMDEFLKEIGQKDRNIKIDLADFKRILTK